MALGICVTPAGFDLFDFVSTVIPSLRDFSKDLKYRFIRSGFISRTAADIPCSLSGNHPIFSSR